MSTTRKAFIWIESIIGIAGASVLVYFIKTSDKKETFVIALITFTVSIVTLLYNIIREKPSSEKKEVMKGMPPNNLPLLPLPITT